MRVCNSIILLLLVGVSVNVVLSDESEEVTIEEDKTSSEQSDDEEDIQYSSPTPSGSYYLAEHFDNIDKFRRRWILSEAKKDDIDEEFAKYDGVWEVQAPQRDRLYGDLGLVLKSKAKHAAISTKLDKIFHFQDDPLIVQYEVNFQEGQECGGAYLKLLSHGKDALDLKHFHDKTPYTIMFGPDKCGNDHKLHFIFRHKNPNNGSFEEKHCRKPKERVEEQFKDKQPHLYTLIIRPDNTFEIRVDHKIVNDGSLLDDFTPPVNPEPEIDDPDDIKPENWDEREKIPDPDAKKPDDWDEDAPQRIVDTKALKPDDWLEDESSTIPDPTAEKPDDWDSDIDGEWEAPLVDNPACESVSGCGPWEPPSIDNPAYKGKWRPPYIDNPNYQGKWKPRKIPNPNFFQDKHPFKMTSIAAVGLELWSMSPMIYFDNILITNSLSVADDYAARTYDLKRRKIDKDSESVLTRILKYSNERPYLYAVYIVAIGLPLALIFVFCCADTKKENEELQKEAEAKKTDAYTPDEVPPPAKSKSQLEVPNEPEPEPEVDEDEEEDDVDVEGEGSQEEEGEAEVEQEIGQGDAPPSPRKRKPRKE